MARTKGSGLNRRSGDGEAQGIADHNSERDSCTPSLPSTQYDYDSIKELSKKLNRPVKTR
jgi:hypothetical protein